jgi:catechol 2,3-dioxygenase-like lactoylglutathione lyase family enzyme
MPSEARLVTLIPIKNMDRAIGFYTTKLGAKLLYRGDGDMKDFWAGLSVAGAEVWFVAPEKREPHKLAYQTLLVKDIRKYVAKLQKAGVKFRKAEKVSKDTKIDGPVASEAFGASAFFQDSEGNTLMVWQNFPPM